MTVAAYYYILLAIVALLKSNNYPHVVHEGKDYINLLLSSSIFE
jgi:hypothetical protein